MINVRQPGPSLECHEISLAHPNRGTGSRTGHADGHIGRGSSSLLLLLGLAEPGLEGEDEGHPGSALEDSDASGDLAVEVAHHPIILYRAAVSNLV